VCVGAFVECEVLDRYALEVGTMIEGPAVIEERESTCVLGRGDRATVDAHLNLVAELANEESDS
jgi:N-methylhydantoinase A